MYPLTTYLQPHNFKQDQFQDVDRSKDEAIDQDSFLSPFHQAQYFSESAVWGNCERLLLQEGSNNLSSTMSNPRKRKSEMIELHGISRKDKHSKVCTARGPRDRRVRLSPRTAIQFYDVQDRLGYDRPSKAIDWLIKEAKTAIDALEEQQQQQTPLGSDNQIISANAKFQGEIIGKQEDLEDDTQVSSFGFFVDRPLEDTILNPGYQHAGFISGLAANFDTNWEVARLQRISGNNQGFCQAEAFQSSIVNYSPIGISFPGFNLVNELSSVTAPGIQKDGAKDRTDLSKMPSFLQYQGIDSSLPQIFRL